MMDHKKLVYICSPFAGDIEQNTENARKYCRSAIENGAIPFAPHLLYPQFMDDSKPEERENSLAMGIEMLEKCDELWVFGQKVSAGMQQEIDHAERIGKPVRFVRDKRQLHAQHWIPCSERMPEPETDVLVVYDDGSMRVMELDTDNRLWRDDYVVSPYHAITHWMPLPELPKEE